MVHSLFGPSNNTCLNSAPSVFSAITSTMPSTPTPIPAPPSSALHMTQINALNKQIQELLTKNVELRRDLDAERLRGEQAVSKIAQRSKEEVADVKAVAETVRNYRHSTMDLLIRRCNTTIGQTDQQGSSSRHSLDGRGGALEGPMCCRRHSQGTDRKDEIGISNSPVSSQRTGIRRPNRGPSRPARQYSGKQASPIAPTNLVKRYLPEHL